MVVVVVVVVAMISTLGLDRLSLHQHEPVDFGADGDKSSDDDMWEKTVVDDAEEDPAEPQELGNSQQPSESDQGDVNMVPDADARALQPQQPDDDDNDGKKASKRGPPKISQNERCRQCVKLKRANPNKMQMTRPKDVANNDLTWNAFRCSTCNRDRKTLPNDCANKNNPQINCPRWVLERGTKCSKCQRLDKATLKDARAAKALKKKADDAVAREKAEREKEEKKRLREAKKGKESADKAAARKLASEYREANKQIREKMKLYAEPYDNPNKPGDDPKKIADTKDMWEKDFIERFGTPQTQKATNPDGSPVVDNAERPPPAGDPRDDRTKLSKDTIKRYTTGREDYMDVDPNGCCLRKKY